MMLRQTFALLVMVGMLASCSILDGPSYPTLIPTEYVPTAIALTVEAGRVGSGSATGVITQQASSTPIPIPLGSATPVRSPTASPTITSAQVTPSSTSLEDTPSPTAQTVKPSPPPASNTPALPQTTVPASPTAISTPTVTATYRWYRTGTPTATPGIPSATILMYYPGEMSRLTSPISLNASLRPGESGQVLIELFGEGGRSLYRELIRYTTTEWVAIVDEVEFDIAAAAEVARLQISTTDEHGRVSGLASVGLILMAYGDNDQNLPADQMEALILREPLENTLYQGGKVVVSGLVRTSGEKPLLVELIDSKGKVVGYRQAVVTLTADRWANFGYSSFVAEVPYSVEGPTWVRLAVSAYEDNLSGPTHVSSMVILLGP